MAAFWAALHVASVAVPMDTCFLYYFLVQNKGVSPTRRRVVCRGALPDCSCTLCTCSQGFRNAEEVQRFSDMMDEMCYIVATKHSGSLKVLRTAALHPECSFA